MIPARHFYMIRHGQTEANAARIMAGSLDSPLTALGRDQARAAAEIISTLDIRPRRIAHSPLSRARDTAAIINEVLRVEMTEEPDIAEIHVGEWEGVHYDLCANLFDDHVDSPGGETFPQFFERVRRGKKKILEAAQDDPVLIVSHGGVFRAMGGIYGIACPGTENCHLHEFEPFAANDPFPWRVWQYDREEFIRRRESALYSCLI